MLRHWDSSRHVAGCNSWTSLDQCDGVFFLSPWTFLGSVHTLHGWDFGRGSLGFKTSRWVCAGGGFRHLLGARIGSGGLTVADTDFGLHHRTQAIAMMTVHSGIRKLAPSIPHYTALCGRIGQIVETGTCPLCSAVQHQIGKIARIETSNRAKSVQFHANPAISQSWEPLS